MKIKFTNVREDAVHHVARVMLVDARFTLGECGIGYLWKHKRTGVYTTDLLHDGGPEHPTAEAAMDRIRAYIKDHVEPHIGRQR